jgi:hypothetical protein
MKGQYADSGSDGPRRWINNVNSQEFWDRMADPDFISDGGIWVLRYKLTRIDPFAGAVSVPDIESPRTTSLPSAGCSTPMR